MFLATEIVELSALLHQDRIVDTSKVLEDGEGVIRQFHFLFFEFHDH